MKLLFYEDWIKSVLFIKSILTFFKINQEQGIPKEKEQQIRMEIIQFMKQLGQYLNLSPETQGKACYIFHAYSQQASFKSFNRFLYGSSAIFLAAKIDDFPKELTKVAKFYLASQILIEEQQQALKQETMNDETDKQLESIIKPQDQTFQWTKEISAKLEKCVEKFDEKVITETKESLCDAELNLLAKIGYDLDIELPYKYIELFKSFHQLDNYWQQIAFNFINDSFFLNICLYFQPYIIALTALKMTSVYLMKEIPSILGCEKKWFQFFFEDTEEKEIDEPWNLMKAIYCKPKQ